MTNQHSITPPPELVRALCDKAFLMGVDGAKRGEVDVWLICEAFRAGADQELDACCQWISDDAEALRIVRRPKPPGLAEEALNQLDTIHIDLSRHCMGFNTDTIRRALERLQELEDRNG